VKEIKDKDILNDLCKNAELKIFEDDQLIYNSENIISKGENYLMIRGNANLYINKAQNIKVEYL